MAHQLVLVLIQDPSAKVLEQTGTLLAQYSTHAKAAPYKQYFEPGVWWDGRIWGEADAAGYARAWEEMNGQPFEHDEKGYYRWLDTNGDGYYDWYTIGGRWDGIFADLFHSGSAGVDMTGHTVEGNICPVALLPETYRVPGSIVTPDGEWHYLGFRLFDDKPSAEAVQEAHAIWQRYAACYAVAVDAHL